MPHRRALFLSLGLTILLMLTAAFVVWLSPAPAMTETDAHVERVRNLLAIGPDETGLGNRAAPIQMIEYASPGCGHCAAFIIETMPRIQKEWIETGQVFYVLRDYPFDDASTAAILIARCVPTERFYPFMELLLRNQPAWHESSVDNPRAALTLLAGQAGMTEQQVESCLGNESALRQLSQRRDDAMKVLNVRRTPTFFVNGERIEGAAAFSEFETKFKAHQPAPK